MNRHTDRLPRSLGALAFAATVVLAALGTVGAPADPAPRTRPLVGDFTGEVLPAGPVYRLPPMLVVADRSVELARIEREERGTGHPHRCAPVPVLPFLVKEVA